VIPFELQQVRRVLMYKRDEITTDLICCDVEADGGDGPITWTRHEESAEWQEWLTELSRLPNFDQEWLEKVTKPPFEECVTLVYKRSDVA